MSSKKDTHIPRSIMNRHPPSNYGDAPPAYLNHDTGSYLSDPESPTNASRLNGGTMRLLPSGDGADDLASSHRAPSPSHYDPDYDHTPYVYPNYLSYNFARFHIPMVSLATEPCASPRPRLGGSMCLRQLLANGHCYWARLNSFLLFGRSSSP